MNCNLLISLLLLTGGQEKCFKRKVISLKYFSSEVYFYFSSYFFIWNLTGTNEINYTYTIKKKNGSHSVLNWNRNSLFSLTFHVKRKTDAKGCSDHSFEHLKKLSKGHMKVYTCTQRSYKGLWLKSGKFTKFFEEKMLKSQILWSYSWVGKLT